MAEKDISILFLEDHRLVREGFAGLLREARPGWTVSGVENSANFFARLAQDEGYALAVLDISLDEDLNGLEILRRIKSKGIRTRTLILSMHDSAALIEKALRLGAGGYINKQAATQELVAGVESVLAGRRFLCSHSERAFARGKLRSLEDASPVDILSNREFEIFLRLADGQSSRAIAEQLRISPKTVANQRLKIFEKLQVETVIELHRLAREHHISS